MSKLTARLLAAGVLLSGTGVAAFRTLAGKEPAPPVRAEEPASNLALPRANLKISSEQFKPLFEMITSHKGAPWLDVHWETDLYAARVRAAKEGKPIFVQVLTGEFTGSS
jgi:hypothetical protein